MEVIRFQNQFELIFKNVMSFCCFLAIFCKSALGIDRVRRSLGIRETRSNNNR